MRNTISVKDLLSSDIKLDFKKNNVFGNDALRNPLL
jgi:hypothetical protein